MVFAVNILSFRKNHVRSGNVKYDNFVHVAKAVDLCGLHWIANNTLLRKTNIFNKSPAAKQQRWNYAFCEQGFSPNRQTDLC